MTLSISIDYHGMEQNLTYYYAETTGEEISMRDHEALYSILYEWSKNSPIELILGLEPGPYKMGK